MVRLGQVPYRREGVVSKYRHMREFWSRGAGPGMVVCGAPYASATPDGVRHVTCNLRRRADRPHSGRHAHLQFRAVPVRWG